jgi:hypothetical protein
MKKFSFISIIIICLLLTAPGILAQTEKTTPAQPKPLEDVSDIMTWKSIGARTLSHNGEWLGYVLAPQEGDGEVIIRQTTSLLGKPPDFPAQEHLPFLRTQIGRLLSFIPKEKKPKNSRNKRKNFIIM